MTTEKPIEPRPISRAEGSGWTRNGAPLDDPDLVPRCDEWVGIRTDVAAPVEGETVQARCIRAAGHRDGLHVANVVVEWKPTAGTRVRELTHG